LLLEAVSYLTSHAYDLKFLARAARKADVTFIVDLAHGAFVSPLRLNDWDVDAAVGCSYKFGCAGPGGVGLLYINGRHWRDPNVWRPGGWWGNERATQFAMGPVWQPATGAAAWQVSSLPILSSAPFLGALELFNEAGISRIHQKCVAATSYLIRGLDTLGGAQYFRVLTPRADNARAAEVAIEFKDCELAKRVKQDLRSQGVLIDYRESPFSSWDDSKQKPGILRVGVHPLFNSFREVHRFIEQFGVTLFR